MRSEDSIESVFVIEPTNGELENTHDDAIDAFDMWGKIQCKLCKEAMRFVEKEVNSDSSKVNANYYSIDCKCIVNKRFMNGFFEISCRKR